MIYRARSSFTLLELLVVIAIISILSSILLPSINKTLEKARGLACASNASQIGKGFVFYQGDNNDFFPVCRADQLFAWNIDGSGNYGRLSPYFSSGLDYPYILGGYRYAKRNSGDPLSIWRHKMFCPGMKPENNPYYQATNNLYSFGYNHRPFKDITKPPPPVSKIKQISKFCLIADSEGQPGIGYAAIKELSPPVTDYLNAPGDAMQFRHSGGANVLYGDGHVANMRLQQAPDYHLDLLNWKNSFWNPYYPAAPNY